MKEEQSKDRKTPRDWSSFLIPFATAPIWGLFAWFGFSAIGFNVWLLICILLLVVKARPELRSYRWFWTTLVLIACAHVPIVLWAPWNGKRFLGAAMKPFLFLDYALIYGMVYLCERIFSRDRKTEEHPDRQLPSLLD